MLSLKYYRHLIFAALCFLQLGCETPAEGVRSPDYGMGVFSLDTGQATLLANSSISSFKSAAYFFSDTDSTIYVFIGGLILQAPRDLSDLNILYRIPDSLSAFQRVNLDLSPDNNYVAWSLGNGQEIGLYLLSLNTLVLKPLRRIPGTNVLHPKFSSDSRKIVYATSAQTGGVATIEVFDIFTGAIDTVMIDANPSRTGGSRLQFPHFSEGNTRVIYMKDSPGIARDSLINVNLSGNDKLLLDPLCRSIGGVVVSRDGSRIVYVKDGNPNPLVSIKSDGTGFHEIADRFSTGSSSGFSISNKGERIAYWMGDRPRLYSLDGDGSNHGVVAQGINGVFSNNLTSFVFTNVITYEPE